MSEIKRLEDSYIYLTQAVRLINLAILSVRESRYGNSVSRGIEDELAEAGSAIYQEAMKIDNFLLRYQDTLNREL